MTKNRFFHVDRTPDVIVTENGRVFGLQTEEFLMSKIKAIADCTVFRSQVARLQEPGSRRPRADSPTVRDLARLYAAEQDT